MKLKKNSITKRIDVVKRQAHTAMFSYSTGVPVRCAMPRNKQEESDEKLPAKGEPGQ